MCIILDINIIPAVFDDTNKHHKDFKPVFEWIYNGKGKIVYGGTKYYDELSRTKYLNLIGNFRKAGKAIPVNNDSVDRETIIASRILKNKRFNDQHLIGLIRASLCLLVCTNDKNSIPFLTNTRFYIAPFKGPKIYSSKRNSRLLSDMNIAAICKPCQKTTNAQRKIIKN